MSRRQPPPSTGPIHLGDAVKEGAVEEMVTVLKSSGFQSIRSYRAYVNGLLTLGAAGVVSFREALAAGHLAKIGAELLLVEYKLKAMEMADVEPNHVLGPDGGQEPAMKLFQAFRLLEELRQSGVFGKDAQHPEGAPNGYDMRVPTPTEADRHLSLARLTGETPPAGLTVQNAARYPSKFPAVMGEPVVTAEELGLDLPK